MRLAVHQECGDGCSRDAGLTVRLRGVTSKVRRTGVGEEGSAQRQRGSTFVNGASEQGKRAGEKGVKMHIFDIGWEEMMS